MPYDPSTDEIRRLRTELHQLQLDHDREVRDRRGDTADLKSRLGLVVLFGIVAISWIALAIVLVHDHLIETCGCG